MRDSAARLSGIALVLLLVAALGTLYVTSRGTRGTEVKVEFRDAFPLLEGMAVRVSGGVAGSVNKLELTDRGTALATLALHEGLDLPRRDATVSVRQADLLGDSYLSLSLGTDEQPLEGTIPPSRAVSAPRIDTVINTFREPVRHSLQILLTEFGAGLERRGEDLNRALVHLRPALKATDELMRELGTQNTALRGLIADTERIGDQAARRSRDLGPTIDSLAETLRAVESRRGDLDRGLATLAPTLARTRGTLVRLRRVTDAARPLAETVRQAAPKLETTASRLPGFLDDAKATARDLRPTLDLTRRAVRVGGPTLSDLKTGLPPLRRLAPELGNLVDSLAPAADELSRGLFGAESYGVGPGRFGETGLGATAVEPPDAATDPGRRYIRIVGIPSCESFGRPITPGCLEDVLADLRASAPRARRAGRSAPLAAGGQADPRGAGTLGELPRELEREGVLVPPRGGRSDSSAGPGAGQPAVPNPLLDFLLGP